MPCVIIFSEPVCLLVIFHLTFFGKHIVEHYSRRPRKTTRTIRVKKRNHVIQFLCRIFLDIIQLFIAPERRDATECHHFRKKKFRISLALGRLMI